jgi:Gpi18-like mannosyltransferase
MLTKKFLPPREAILFAGLMWLLSRSLVLLAVIVIAPHQSLPPSQGLPATGSWQDLLKFDSFFYVQIATQGYEFADDGKPHNVAFFPLLPLLIRGAMLLGWPAEVAGLAINNFAFLAALVLLYGWVAARHSPSAARWTTAFLAWCPFSLFCTVLYTEGLFLLCTTAALRAFDRHQHLQAAFWGLLSSATRLPGVALVPAFLLTAWRQKRSPIAYLSGLGAGGGILLYSLFCWVQFRDPIAFLKVQQAWQPQIAYGVGWVKMLVQITLGPRVWNAGRIVDPWYPLTFFLLGLAAYGLWRWRTRIGPRWFYWGFCTLGLLLWALAGAPLINGLIVWGGLLLVWSLRQELPVVVLLYGLANLGLILATGRTTSLERFAYGNVAIAIGFGLWVARAPRWGYPVMGLFACLLASLAVKFAQFLWVG